MATYDLTVKLILLGDYGVNKGIILRALAALPEEPEVKCLSKRVGLVEMLFVREDKRIRVKILDTAGQERYRSITSSFYRGANGCLLLFDVTQKSTFESLAQWEEELRQHSVQDDMEVVLAGLNCHVASSERQVAKRTAQEFASYLQMPYEEVSVTIVTTLVTALENLVDRIVLKASRVPALSRFITPLSQKMLDKQQSYDQQKVCKYKKCSC